MEEKEWVVKLMKEFNFEYMIVDLVVGIGC